MSHILTAIAGTRGQLTASLLTRLADAVRGTGAEPGPADWLAQGWAADIALSGGDPAGVEAAARIALEGEPVDLAVRPAAGRRKQLLIADMDATMITGETLDELAAVAGIGARVAAITARAMRGEIDFRAALAERVAMLKGLPVSALAEAHGRLPLTEGGITLVRTMRAHGAHTVLVSGGFRYFTALVRDACGFHHDIANELELLDDALTGRVLEPIVDRTAKLAALRQIAAELGLTLDQTLAVGDGANDLDMIGAAGMGVAYHAKPVVAEQAAVRVDHADLTALLFLQGYREGELVGE